LTASKVQTSSNDQTDQPLVLILGQANTLEVQLEQSWLS